jgi:hypothetical protein
MHDILNEELIQRHKSMGLLPYKIQEDHFRVTDLTCRLRGNQLIHKTGEMLLDIDITVSKVFTPDIKDKRGKPSTGVKVSTRQLARSESA